MDFYDQVLSSLPYSAFKLNAGGTAYSDITGKAGSLGQKPKVNLVLDPLFQTTSGTVEIRRNLCTNPTLETNSTSWGTMGSATGSRLTSGGYVGPALWQVVTNGVATFEGISVSGMVTSAFQSYAGRIALRVESGTASVNIYVRINYTDATLTDSAYVAQTVTTTWQEFTSTVATPTAGKTVSSVQLFARTSSIQAITLQGDAALMEIKAAPAGPYFDGGTAASGGITYAWTGTANASASTATGVKISGTDNHPSGGASYRSTIGVPTGQYSLAVASNRETAGTNDSFSQLPITASLFQPGKTYVISGTVHLTAPQGAGAHSSARGYRVTWNGVGLTITYLQAAPNTAGTHRVVAKFTIPAQHTGSSFIRVHNGGPIGDPTVYWSNINIEEETPMYGGFFSGASTNKALNPGAEVNTTSVASMGTQGSTVTRDTAVKRTGTASFKIVCNGASSGVKWNVANGQLLPGRQYTITMYAFTNDSGVGLGRYGEGTRSDTGGYLAFVTSSVEASQYNLTPGVWERITWTFTTSTVLDPNLTSGMGWLFAATTGSSVWVDDVSIHEYPYAEGTTYSWSGAANNSPSYAVAPINTTTNTIVAGSEKSIVVSPAAVHQIVTGAVLLDIKQPISMEAWFLPMYYSGTISIMSRTNTFDGLSFDGDKLHMKVKFQGQGEIDAAWPVPDFPDAMHVVGTWSGRSVQLYVNGELKASADATDAQIAAGHVLTPSPYLFAGESYTMAQSAVVDGFAVYSKVLSDAEIYRHFKAGRRVIASQDISGAYGGFGWNDMRRDVFSYTEWSGKDWYNGVYTDVEFEGGGLRPAENPATQLSIAGVWTGVYPIGAYGSTVYGVKVDWDGDGSYVVQASLDGGSTWTSSLVNGRTVAGTWSWNSTDKTLLVRVTFTGGVADDIAEIRRLRVTGYTTTKVYGNDNSRYIDLENVSVAVANEGNEPIENNSGAGIETYGTAAVIKSDATDDIRPVAALEAWVKFNESPISKYVLDARPGGDDSYLWVSGSGVLAWAGAAAVYVNGKQIFNSTFKPVAGVWYHYVFVYDTPINTDIKFPSTGNKNIAVANVYPTAPTAAQVASMYSAYNGYPSSLLATDDINVQELATPFKTYGYDWSMTGVG